MTPNPQSYRLIQNIHRIGLAAEKPSFDAVLPGTLWYSTDTGTLERATSTGWEAYSSTGSGGGVLIPHHVEHEPGGTDALVNAAWTNVQNVFTDRQTIGPGAVGINPILEIIDSTGEGARVLFRDLTSSDPVNSQIAVMRFQNGSLRFTALNTALGTEVSGWDFFGGKLILRGPIGFPPSISFYTLFGDFLGSPKIQALADNTTLLLTSVNDVGRKILLAAGFGDTPLDASQLLSGSIPDARLSANVPLKDTPNTFTGTPQTISQVTVPELRFNQTGATVGIKNTRLAAFNGEFYFQRMDDFGTTVTFQAFRIGVDGDAFVSRDVYERNRTVPMGHWIEFTPVFTADAGTVTLSNDFGSKYTLIGNTMIVSCLLGITLSGTPNAIYMTIPGGFTSGNVYMAGAVSANGAGEAVWRVDPTSTFIIFIQNTLASINWPTGTNFIGFTASFEIV